MVYLVVGSPATGGAFYDRETLLKEICRILKVDNILLVAPRKFGKTSIMLHLRDSPREDIKAIYLDVEWISKPEDFIAEVFSALLEEKDKKLIEHIKKAPAQLLKIFQKTVDTVSISELRFKLREELKEDWKNKSTELFKLMEGYDKKIIFLVDELPIMLDRLLKKSGKEETEEFLHWFKSLRMLDGAKNVRFIVGGSIGIEHILRKIGTVALVSDLRRVSVMGFERKEAQEFIEALLKKENLKADKEAIKEILNIIDEPIIPYFIQVLISAISNEAIFSKKREITRELIKEVYESKVLGVECKPYFEHYYQRMPGYYTESELKAARRILKELCKVGEIQKREVFNLYVSVIGKPDEEEFNDLMSDLENDFYIKYYHDRDSYGFSTKILKDWWRRYYGLVDNEEN